MKKTLFFNLKHKDNILLIFKTRDKVLLILEARCDICEQILSLLKQN